VRQSASPAVAGKKANPYHKAKALSVKIASTIMTKLCRRLLAPLSLLIHHCFSPHIQLSISSCGAQKQRFSRIGYTPSRF
jgi:hypothetical protein